MFVVVMLPFQFSQAVILNLVSNAHLVAQPSRSEGSDGCTLIPFMPRVPMTTQLVAISARNVLISSGVPNVLLAVVGSITLGAGLTLLVSIHQFHRDRVEGRSLPFR